MVSCCKLFGVKSFVLVVTLLSGNDALVNLHQTNVILCSNKKGKVPRYNFPRPLEIQVLAEEADLSWQLLSHTQLSPLREPDAQDPAGPQTPQANQWQGPGPTDCDPDRGPLPLLHRGGDRGEVHCHLKASA